MHSESFFGFRYLNLLIFLGFRLVFLATVPAFRRVTFAMLSDFLCLANYICGMWGFLRLTFMRCSWLLCSEVRYLRKLTLLEDGLKCFSGFVGLTLRYDDSFGSLCITINSFLKD